MALYDVLTAFQAPLYGDGEQMNQRVASARVHFACERAFICVKDSFSETHIILVRKRKIYL